MEKRQLASSGVGPYVPEPEVTSKTHERLLANMREAIRVRMATRDN